MSDLREHEMARRADLFLHPKPGTDLVWLCAISRYLLDNGSGAHGVPGSVGQWPGGVSQEPGAVHAWSIAARISGLAGGDPENSRAA